MRRNDVQQCPHFETGPVLSKGPGSPGFPRHRDTVLRCRVLQGDPVTNLKALLGILQSPRDPGFVAADFSGTADGDMNKLHSVLEAGRNMPEELQALEDLPFQTLVRRQDEYIDQLEKENKMLKAELTEIGRNVREVVAENHRLIQHQKTAALTIPISQAPTRLAPPKGLSDEEKMVQGQENNIHSNSKGIEFATLSHFEKMHTLLEDLAKVRYELQLKVKEVEELKSASGTRTGDKDDENRIMSRLKAENEDLIDRNVRLETLVVKMRQRDEEAQDQIQKNILLVERIHFEKQQMLLECEKLKKELEKKEKWAEDLQAEHQRKLDDVHRKNTEIQKSIIEMAESKHADLVNNLVSMQASVEESHRENVNLRHHLEKTQQQVDRLQHMREFEMSKEPNDPKIVSDGNSAVQHLAEEKRRAGAEHEKQQKELLWLKSELEVHQRRLEDVETRYSQARLDALSLGAKQNLKWAKMLTFQEGQSRETTTGERVTRVKLKRELMEMMREIESKHAIQISELEKMIESQLTLVNHFKRECQLLSQKVEHIVQQYRNTSENLIREKTLLLQQLSSANQKCKDMETACAIHKEQQLAMAARLQSTESKVEAQNEKVTELLNRQNALLKERQFLADELIFFKSKFNQVETL